MVRDGWGGLGCSWGCGELVWGVHQERGYMNLP